MIAPACSMYIYIHIHSIWFIYRSEHEEMTWIINSFQMDSWLANGLWFSLFLALAGNAGGLRSWSKSDRWWSKKLRLRLGLKIGYPNSWWFLIIVPMLIKWVINDDEWQAGGFKMVHISGLFRYLFDSIQAAALPLFNIWSRFYGYLEGLDISIHDQHN